MVLLKNIGKACAFLMLVPFLFSCASYNQQASEFYSNLSQGDYKKASKNLDNNRLLKKKRNRILYLLEKGRVEHLLHHFEESNRYFNEADLLMEDSRTSARYLAASLLINPMMDYYKGEDFEKYMVHYYKALNYLQLNQASEALVEARRISLRTYAQEDKVKGEKYTEDAFSFMLQGMIYEKANEANNAFIAYRNAVDVFLESNGSFYGTPIPLQLKKDLLRTAHQNGFIDQVQHYEAIFQMKVGEEEGGGGGELILFWENGLAPVKKEKNLLFSLMGDDHDNYYFTDHDSQYKVPFNNSSNYRKEELKLGALQSLRVVIPYYEPQASASPRPVIEFNGSSLQMETAQNINDLALATLDERRIKDLTATLARLAIKKLAEEAAKPDDKEKQGKKKSGQEALSMGFKIYGMASEKADTRNWQSLPHTIYYTRIPLHQGSNKITILSQDNHGRAKNIEIEVAGQGALEFRNISSIQ